MEEELKTGDWAIFVKENTGHLESGTLVKMAFVGEDKYIDEDLLKRHPSKSGWYYEKDYRKATEEEIQRLGKSQGLIIDQPVINNYLIY